MIASIVVQDEQSLTAIVFGQFVKLSIIINKYLFPLGVILYGPPKSICRISKGKPVKMGVSGALLLNGALLHSPQV